jgi:hypothetical protein
MAGRAFLHSEDRASGKKIAAEGKGSVELSGGATMVSTVTGGLTDTSLCQDDVLIAFRNGRWELGTASTLPSITCESLEAAMTIAGAFSTVHHVDVWLSHGVSLRRIVSARTCGIDAVSA